MADFSAFQARSVRAIFIHMPGLSIAAALASVPNAFVGAFEALAAATYEGWQRELANLGALASGTPCDW